MTLEELCRARGIETEYWDIWGTRRRAPDSTLVALLAELGVDAPAAHEAEATPAPAPPRCWRPPALEGDARLWGPVVQLYSLRSERNWGIGDFGDLARLAEQFAARGADLVGVSPLHALFPGDPAHASPYSPSSRLALNVLYLDVEAIADFAEDEQAQRRVRSPEFRARLARLREPPLVDYPGVAAAKFEVLEMLYAGFRERHVGRGDGRERAFRAFQATAGETLRRHALHEALQEKFRRVDPAEWPADCRDCESEAVRDFGAANAARVEFFEYLQWQAEEQLARVAARCESLGMALGLYLDLALSADRTGSEVWAGRRSFALGASIGAPPDDFNLNGQDWGLPPPRPDELRRARYAPFAQALRANMRHAGALRIDHVMGLMRLYWVPLGAAARDGAYVHYDLEEMLAIVALESQSNRCLVIGEDLGTVPDEVRQALARCGALSCRLLYFERDAAGGFRAPAEYPREALVAVSTHDLPTLAGWWRERAQDRAPLLQALGRAGRLPAGLRSEAPPPELDAALARAVHEYLALAPARLMAVQLEDMLGVTEQANVPGTTHEHPNWRRKLPLTLEAMAADPRVEALSRALAAIRTPGPREATGASPS